MKENKIQNKTSKNYDFTDCGRMSKIFSFLL